MTCTEFKVSFENADEYVFSIESAMDEILAQHKGITWLWIVERREVWYVGSNAGWIQTSDYSDDYGLTHVIYKNEVHKYTFNGTNLGQIRRELGIPSEF